MAAQGPRWRRFQKIKTRNLTRSARRAEGATMRHARRFLVGRWDNIRDVRRHIMTWMIGIALLITVVGVQMIWFQQSYLTNAAVSGGVYAEAVQGPVSTLNPLYATTDAELAVDQLLFSSLYKYDTTGHLNTDTARSMTISDDEKTYTIAMKPNLRWEDGQPLTAKDVVFTVNLMKSSEAQSTMMSSWKDFTATAVDDHTVKFSLPAAYAAFPQALTFSILPQHILKDVNKQSLRESSFSTSPVGSGPFKLRLVQTISSGTNRKVVHMAANDYYYGGTPKLERYQLYVYESMDAIASALRTGEVAAAADVNATVAQSVSKDKYDVKNKPIDSGVYAIINTTQPITKDSAVRQALQVATDTDTIRSSLYGKPKQLYLPFVENQLSSKNLPSAPSYNVSEAKKILDAAGWKQGNDGVRQKNNQKLELRVVTRKNSDYERTLELLAGQWRKIGVSVDKEVVDSADASKSFTQTVLQARNYDVLVDELTLGADPDVFAYWHSRGLLNFSNYDNQTSDDALVGGRDHSDSSVRNIKYETFAKQWLKDVPAIGLYQSNMIYVKSKSLTSIDGNQSIVSPSTRFADVVQWSAVQRSVFKTP